MIDVTAIEKRSSISFLEAVFDAHARGEVALLVDRLGDAPPAGIRVARQVSCTDGGGWFSRHVAPQGGDEPAQITLTSGTTGLPKPILLSRGALADTVTRLIDVMGLTSDIREYVGVPVTYSFGFGRVRAVAAVGGASFLPENGFRIDELAAMLRNGEVNALSAVPTLLRLVLQQQAQISEAGKMLRWLEIGSQAMSAAEKAAVRDIFPNARIVQHYGLTEASRSTFLDVSGADEAALDSVGSPNGAVEVRITDEGLIAVRGPHVASGIVTADGVEPLTDAQGWLVTRDMGHLIGGKLFFEGRVDHLLNVGGIKVSAEAFETQLAAALPAGAAFAIAGGQDPLRGQTILVAHPDTLDSTGCRVLHEAAAEVAAAHGVAGAFTLLPVAAIPVTDTGKVQRGEITKLFDQQAQIAAAAPPASAATSLAAVYARALNRLEIGPEDSFASLGGDSLGYIEVSLEIERRLGHLPEHWETLTIAQVEQMATAAPPPAKGRLVTVETEMLIRPVAMTTIVTSHALAAAPGLASTAEYWKGGALALLLAAGYNLCRFQKDTLLSERRLAVLGNYARRILLPFYVLVLYKCLQWAAGGPYVAWSTFALLDDYIRPAGASSFVVYWFIDVLFQCVLILTALFYLRPARELARRSGFWFGLALLAFAYAVKIAVHTALLPKGALLFPNNQLDRWGFAFALGWMVAEARSDGQRIACIALGIVAASLDWGLLDFHTAMLLIAILLILYLPSIRIPDAISRPVALWARSTFFIYLTHGFAMAVMRAGRIQAMLGHSEVAIVVATLLLSTVGGVAAYLLWLQGERILAMLLGRLRKGRNSKPATQAQATS